MATMHKEVTREVLAAYERSDMGYNDMLHALDVIEDMPEHERRGLCLAIYIIDRRAGA